MSESRNEAKKRAHGKERKGLCCGRQFTLRTGLTSIFHQHACARAQVHAPCNEPQRAPHALRARNCDAHDMPLHLAFVPIINDVVCGTAQLAPRGFIHVHEIAIFNALSALTGVRRSRSIGLRAPR